MSPIAGVRTDNHVRLRQLFSPQIWVWLKIKKSWVTRVLVFGSIYQGAIWYHFFEPQPYYDPGPKKKIKSWIMGPCCFLAAKANSAGSFSSLRKFSPKLRKLEWPSRCEFELPRITPGEELWIHNWCNTAGTNSRLLSAPLLKV